VNPWANQKGEIMETLDNNIEYSLDKNILTLKVDLSKDFGRTSGGTGKNLQVATTHGAARIGGAMVTMTVYKRP
jgi:hypothetical protein